MSGPTTSRAVAFAAAALLASSLSAEPIPGWMSRLSIHGYLSQAYAISEDHQIFGIPTDGTTEYRDVALQFRYDPDRRNALVLQFRHERRGESGPSDDPVDVDWAFYQHAFGDRFALKAGRIPLPLGIFNEAGGAAATSPFFRPPTEFYARQYSSKTVDGVLASSTLGAPAGWSFDVDGYYGRWVVDTVPNGPQADADDAYGAQVWVNTPLQGVRVGTGAYRCRVEPRIGESTDYVMLHGSIDADFDRWRLAGEYLSGNLDHYGRYRAWYTQAGLQVTRRVSVHARGAIARLRVPVAGHSLHPKLSNDVGLAVNYALRPALLFKVEGHTNEGLLREDIPRNLYADPSRTRYFIASVVASF